LGAVSLQAPTLTQKLCKSFENLLKKSLKTSLRSRKDKCLSDQILTPKNCKIRTCLLERLRFLNSIPPRKDQLKRTQ
jgi:hypothetical protein